MNGKAKKSLALGIVFILASTILVPISHAEGTFVAPGTLGAIESQRKLARTSDGFLHCVYSRSDGLHSQIYHSYSVNNGETWYEEPLTSESYNQENPVIATDSLDYLHVLWQGCHIGSPTRPQIRYRKYTTQWNAIINVTTDTTYGQVDPAIAIDSQDVPHVVWSRIDILPHEKGSIQYSKYTTSWSTPLIIGKGLGYVEEYPYIVVDKNDIIHVAWSEGGLHGSGCWHTAYRRFTTIWGPVEEFECLTRSPYLAVDSQGIVHLVTIYLPQDPSYEGLRYRKRLSSGWTSPVTIVSVTPGKKYPSIAVDSNDYLHVVWTDNGNIKYRTYTSSWQNIETLISDTDSSFPNLLSTWFPVVDAGHPNIPQNGYAFVWNDGPSIRFYKSPDLIWDGGGTQPPEKPSLISPGTPTDTGFTVTTKTPTFEWNSVPNTDYYALYISHEPYGEANLVYDSEEDYPGGKLYGTSFNELPNDILQDGVKYRWDMRAFNDYGTSEFSNELYFKIQIPTILDISIRSKPLEFYNDEPPFLPNVLKIKAIVTNEGNTAANYVDVKFYLNGVLIGSDYLGTINPGELGREAIVTWTPSSVVENGEITVEAITMQQEDSVPSNNIILPQPVSFYWVDFQHNRDAFSFPNWKSASTEEMMNQLKNFLLQQGFLLNIIDLLKAPLTIIIGNIPSHCYGMAVSSLLYRLNPALKPVDKITFQMTKEEAAPNIIKHHFEQILLLPQFIHTLHEQYKPFDVNNEYQSLLNYLKQDKAVVIALPYPMAGHGVVVYKILDLGVNRKEVFIYENNKPYDDPNDGYILKDPLNIKTRDINITIRPNDENQNYLNYKLVTPRGTYEYNRFYTVNPILMYNYDDLKNLLIDAIKDLIKYIYKELKDSTKNLLHIYCPVTCVITDEYNRKIQYLDGEIINEIPGAELIKNNDSYLFYLPSDIKYYVNLTGTDTGFFNIDYITPISESTANITLFKNITINTDMNACFYIERNGSISDVLLDNTELISPNITSPFNISNFPPIAKISLPRICYSNTDINFSGNNSYDLDGNLTLYQWDFGDGTYGTGIVVTHSYSHPGNYTIKLTVTDDGNLTSNITKNIFINDGTSPITSKSIRNPKYGANDEWITSSTIFNLTATDDFSGINTTYYRIWYNGAWTPWNEYTGNFSLTGEGKHYLEYYSVDNAGNVEETHNQTHNIDDAGPSITISATPCVLWPPNNKMKNVLISGSATDAGSGLASITFTVKDEYDLVEPTLTGFGQTIQLQAMRYGYDFDGRIYTITATATDNLGNVATASAVVLVPHDQGN